MKRDTSQFLHTQSFRNLSVTAQFQVTHKISPLFIYENDLFIFTSTFPTFDFKIYVSHDYSSISLNVKGQMNKSPIRNDSKSRDIAAQARNKGLLST